MKKFENLIFIFIVILSISLVECFRLQNYHKKVQNGIRFNRFDYNLNNLQLHGRKIEDEAEELKKTSVKSKKSNKKKYSKDKEKVEISPNNNLTKEETTEDSNISEAMLIDNSNEKQTITTNNYDVDNAISFDENEFQSSNNNVISESNIDLQLSTESESGSKQLNLQDILNSPEQSIIPPEIVFFGEPRYPPPVETANDPKYHGRLLYWARHATVAPRNSVDRLELVFPKGRFHPEATKYRYPSDKIASLTFDEIYSRFKEISSDKSSTSDSSDLPDLEASKAFINSNIDVIPSKLFLRALTARKLEAQMNNDLAKMEEYKLIRRRYILANDQIFFPLNIEIHKAETRVMTYLSRPEIKDYSREWDEVEISLYYVTLLAARLTWDKKVNQALDSIKTKLENTVSYMREGIRKDLFSREFRKIGVTAEVYRNGSYLIESTLPLLYNKIRPEIKFLHETYDLKEKDDIVRYADKEFCPKNGLAKEQLREKLKVLDATLAGIQGLDYNELRLRCQRLCIYLSTPIELEEMDKWYFDMKEKQGPGGLYAFETYEPDDIPKLLKFLARNRDTGNEFTNFAVQVLQQPTKYSYFFDNKRKKASAVDNWLYRDPEYTDEGCNTYDDVIESFREAYLYQMEQRRLAENKLFKYVDNIMDKQDKVLINSEVVRSDSKVLEIDDNN